MTLTLLDEGIAARVKAVEEAKQELRSLLETTQAKCSHPVLFHVPYERLDFFPSLPAVRICALCRKEEEARGFSERFEILHGENLEGQRVIASASRSDLHALRIRP